MNKIDLELSQKIWGNICNYHFTNENGITGKVIKMFKMQKDGREPSEKPLNGVKISLNI